jgi:hypothetical protein
MRIKAMERTRGDTGGPKAVSGRARGWQVRAPANPRLQRPTLRAAAEPPSR